VAVIGVDFQDVRGELPRAYVVLDPVLALTTTDVGIQKFLIGKLSRYKALDGGVRRVESLPRSSTGKVIKNIFREQAKQEILEEKIKATTSSETEDFSPLMATEDPKGQILVPLSETKLLTTETTVSGIEKAALSFELRGSDEVFVSEENLVSEVEGSEGDVFLAVSSQHPIKNTSGVIVEDKEVFEEGMSD